VIEAAVSKRLVEVLSNELSQRRQFGFADVNTHLDFDCNRYIRLLGRLGFLKAVKDGNSKRITGFVRTASWPPPPTFFSQGAIGVAHYIQKWFRFKLQEDPLENARFHSPRVMPEANLNALGRPPPNSLQIFDRIGRESK
jgi:hypothetical protein